MFYSVNSRQSRLYLAAKCKSFLEGIDSSFSPTELLKIESLLNEEFMKHLWLYNICNCVVTDSVFISDDEMKEYLSVGSGKVTSKEQLKEAEERRAFLKEKLQLLKFQEEKLKNAVENKLAAVKKLQEKKDEQISRKLFYLKCRVNELCDQLEVELQAKPSFNNPKESVKEILNKIKTEKVDKEFDQWIAEIVDELTLTGDNELVVVDQLNSLLQERLEHLHQQLTAMMLELKNIRNYYFVNIKEELEWRNNLKEFAEEVSESKRKPKTKKKAKAILKKEEFVEVEKVIKIDHSPDELDSLIEKLKQNIESLQNQFE